MKIIYIALLLSISSICYSQSSCPGIDSLNYSGQWYHTVQIGSQCWLKENLNIGTMMAADKYQSNNDTIEKLCYNNDPAMCDIYGGLYQWKEAVQYTKKERTRGICPIGWHIPQKTEFDSLNSFVNGNGNALKDVSQIGGTNTSGFSALLSGINQLTSFYNLGNESVFWSSTIVHIGRNGYYGLYANNLGLQTNNLIFDDTYIYNGLYSISVRCIKDNFDLLLQAPYGGEGWQTGASHKITWGGLLADKKIKIEYTTDNGISWIEIIDSTPAIDGEYNWAVPNTPSPNCKVRITDLNDISFKSISDAVFTIYSSSQCGSPIEYGGQLYNTVEIGKHCWFKENLNLGNMIPGGQESAINGIIEKYCYNNDTANCSKYGGLYQFSETYEEGFCPFGWYVGELSSLNLDVLYDANALKDIGQGAGFGAGTNTSGFSALLAGQRWQGTFNGIGAQGYFPVGLSVFTGADYVIDDGSTIYNTDQFGNSGGSMRCVHYDAGPLLLKSPTGGESWLIGSIHKITWTYSNVINIKLDYSTDNGSNWINVIPSIPTSSGSFNWTVPTTPSMNCKVRISSVNNPDTNSVSNIFQIYQVPTNPCPGIPTVVYGGLTYNTIAIGEQCWMRENLNIGSIINGTLNQSDNGVIEKYCYNNDTNNCSIYGGLYQWNEAMQYNTVEDSKGICPIGWHVPTWNDFTTLKSLVSNNGNALKELGQGTGPGAGTNTSGFSALLGGINNNGTFVFFGNETNYWTSKMSDLSNSLIFYLVNTSSNIYGGTVSNYFGYSIRCLNDSSVSALPVELTTFFASILANDIKLKWTTATELNTSLFTIERKLEESQNWIKIASLPATGNSNTPKIYSYIDKDVMPGHYNYRLKIFDYDGSYKYSNEIGINILLPFKFELNNAYPNPWNPTTTIRYQVPKNILVTIKVFDALGREVSTLVNEIKPAGNYEITFNGKGLSSGTYYYQMKSGTFMATKKIILIK